MTPKPTDLRKGIEALASGWRQSWAQPIPGDTSLFFNRAGSRIKILRIKSTHLIF
jgi:hypothetical protein